MELSRDNALLRRCGELDLSLCLLCNRAVHRRWGRAFFAAVSRLGDGVFWYSLMAVLPLHYGLAGLAAAAHMMGVALAGLVIYKLLKRNVTRQRPFVSHQGRITLGARPLDAHSFPSGHTLHAVAFTTVAASHYPHLLWVLLPFAVLVALSRPILGLHYPSDVLAGAGIGASLALLSLGLPGL